MRLLKKITWVAGIILLCCTVSMFFIQAEAVMNSMEQKKAPLTAGRTWRIAYCESGEFSNYASTLHGLVLGLTKLGLLEGAEGLPYVKEQVDTRVMWNWLATRRLGSSLEFVGDAYYTFGHRDKAGQKKVKEQIIERLNQGDIDILIVMGTQGGKELSNNLHHVPTFIFSTSNAVQAGIINSITDSGFDHVWAHMDPTRYQRQLEVFHDLFAFKKLGMVYENSIEGQSFAAVTDVEKVAKERGFAIVPVFVKDRQNDKNRYHQEMLEAHQVLAKQGVDAVYSTLYFDREVTKLPQLFAPFYEGKIPVFAQQGGIEVRNGALLSVSRADFRGIGYFGAQAIAQSLQGVLPRHIPQVYENTPNIVLNLEVAEKVGYAPTFDILLAADEIYQAIENKK